MCKAVIKAFILLLFVSISLVGEAKTLKVGVVDFPPHIHFENDKISGPLYKYISEVFNLAGYQAQFISLPGGRASMELVAGRLDLLLPIDGVTAETKVLSKPLFHSIPGLCFKKENFIPILSANYRLNKLSIGIPTGVTVVPAITRSKAVLVPLKGDNTTDRGIELTQRGRIDAFYHPNPGKVYHRKNPLYKEVACSYFHGYSTPVHVVASEKLAEQSLRQLNTAYLSLMNKESYEFYFASRR